jgi:adenosylcobyric acid synthase
MKGLMIQGTSSDAGKSYIVTALCRIFADKGYQVAPFKSQNMSNNSYVTLYGEEIGRAQGVQAEAARQIANVHMNPILLKPRKDTKSEVVLHGKVYKSYSGMAYGKEFTLTKGMEAVRESLDYLDQHYDMIIIEGAGSPAEVNLNDREIVNMRIAQAADVDVILVADIDRGGSFASLIGTIELVFEHRHRIKGVIFNKFRGDIRLLQDGLDWFEAYTHIPVIGVIPYMQDIHIETEDAQSHPLVFQKTEKENLYDQTENTLDIGIIHMERVSNNTDIEPFMYEPDCRLRIIRTPEDFQTPHAIIIPGTKSTIDDLLSLKANGLFDKIIDYQQNEGRIFGLCGGFQILGQHIFDEHGSDHDHVKVIDGLGLLAIDTQFHNQKIVKQVQGKVIAPTFNDPSIEVKGYEIHLGETKYLDHAMALIELDDHRFDGCVSSDGHVLGSYLHHIFHNDHFRQAWLNQVRTQHGFEKQACINTGSQKEDAYDLLAQRVSESLHMDRVQKIIDKEVIRL